MSGTIAGGQATAATNKAKYGEDYYKEIGKKGAEAYKLTQEKGIAKPRGFAYNRELARTAGAKGGTNSKRGKARSHPRTLKRFTQTYTKANLVRINNI